MATVTAERQRWLLWSLMAQRRRGRGRAPPQADKKSEADACHNAWIVTSRPMQIIPYLQMVRSVSPHKTCVSTKYQGVGHRVAVCFKIHAN